MPTSRVPNGRWPKGMVYFKLVLLSKLKRGFHKKSFIMNAPLCSQLSINAQTRRSSQELHGTKDQSEMNVTPRNSHIRVTFRDVTTGATGATEVAPKLLDTLTLSPTRGADSGHHRRGRI